MRNQGPRIVIERDTAIRASKGRVTPESGDIDRCPARGERGDGPGGHRTARQASKHTAATPSTRRTTGAADEPLAMRRDGRGHEAGTPGISESLPRLIEIWIGEIGGSTAQRE